MNFLLQAAGMSLKSGVAAYMALSMATNPVQTAAIQQAANPAPQPKIEAKLELSQDRATVQTTLLKVCEDRGYGEECAKDLLGMLWKESLNNPKALGDQGRAHGYFQIWTTLHKISIACAEDLVCSSNWTLDYLESNGYAKYPSYAIQCHNGCNIDNGYAASARRHGRRLWDQPLPIGGGDSQVALK